jgi:hypothetical protein
LFLAVTETTQAITVDNEDFDEESEIAEELDEADEVDDFPEAPTRGKVIKMVKNGKIYLAQEVGNLVLA